MYIVQVRNPQRFSWKELPATNCKFKEGQLDKAIELHNKIKNSNIYAGMLVRIWSTESDHRVEF